MITVEQAKDSVRRLVKRKGGDYIYPEKRCLYVKDDKPSCGIGIIMHEDYGVPIKTLKDWDNNYESGVMIGQAARNIASRSALMVFGRFQAAQDQHRPYKECAKLAEVEL